MLNSPPIDRAGHGLELRSASTAFGRARAKVNLTLRVLGRLSDGFHRIESVLVPISLCDDLSITLRRGATGVRVACELDAKLAAHVSACAEVDASTGAIVAGLSGAENLAAKAAARLLDRSGEAAGVEISLIKRIPFGAGLGGGSADAATTLVVLNALLGDPLSDAELYEISAELGSDVTALLSGQPVAVAGRGERLFPLSATARFYDYFNAINICIVKPPFGSPTAAAYGALGLVPSEDQDKEAERLLGTTALPESLLKEIHSLGFVSASSAAPNLRATEQLTLSGSPGISPGLDSPPQGGGLWDCLVNDFKRSVVDANPRLAALYRTAEELVAEVGGTLVLSGSGSALVLFLPRTKDARMSEQDRRAAESTFEARIRAVEPGSFVSCDLSLGHPVTGLVV